MNAIYKYIYLKIKRKKKGKKGNVKFQCKILNFLHEYYGTYRTHIIKQMKIQYVFIKKKRLNVHLLEKHKMKRKLEYI